MHIGPDYGNPIFRIRAYDENSITINETIYYQNILLFETTLISPWTNKAPSQLVYEDFVTLIDMRPELLVVGTGKAQLFFAQSITAMFQQHHIGLETMTTGAACRTYTVLASEDRKVMGLFFI